jgi:hypothetical protein
VDSQIISKNTRKACLGRVAHFDISGCGWKEVFAGASKKTLISFAFICGSKL